MIANLAIRVIFMKMLIVYFNTCGLVIMTSDMHRAVYLWQGKCHKQKQNQRPISQSLHHSKIGKQKLMVKVDIPKAKDIILRLRIRTTNVINLLMKQLHI